MHRTIQRSFNSSIEPCAFVILFSLCLAFIPAGSIAHSDDLAEVPWNDPPTIDGIVEEQEWNGSGVINLTVEGNDVGILFKHDRDSIYFGFDIHEGHNSAFPDTRVFFDLDHDAASTPQDDDYQLYINPDHQDGPLIERQGDGSEWQPVDTTHWTGDYNEDGSDHWTTEYDVSSEKFEDFAGNETFGFCLLVYGNSPGAFDTWPDGADIDDPSTWGDVSFLNWTEDDEDDPPPPPLPPPGGNTTDPNGTDEGNTTGDDEDDFLSLPFHITMFGIGISFIAIERTRAEKRQT